MSIKPRNTGAVVAYLEGNVSFTLTIVYIHVYACKLLFYLCVKCQIIRKLARNSLRKVYAVLISNDALWWCAVIFNFVNAYYVSRNPRRLSASRKSSSYSIWTTAMLVQLQLFKKDSYQWNVCILEMLLTSRIWWASGFDAWHGDRLGTCDYHVMAWACFPLLNMK